ncbi:hypothetical protein DPMN_060395 [Dreissena polymorpha]|uniref:Uncharacterized protein n=1 Tax=Dreissena polymorpha TaxID=45954 RepID=A0A9D4HFZ2_DREPO|nr:hypothetical protein DPMN_060395 [Dreissena polymorpha]
MSELYRKTIGKETGTIYVVYGIFQRIPLLQTSMRSSGKSYYVENTKTCYTHHNRFVDEYVLDGDAANGWFAGVLHQPSGVLEPRKARGR